MAPARRPQHPPIVNPGQPDHPSTPTGDERALPAASVRTIEAIVAEVGRQLGVRTPHIDLPLLRTRLKDIAATLNPSPAEIRPGAPDELPAHRFMFGQAVDEVEALQILIGSVIHARRRYGARARALAKKYLPLLKRLRKRAGLRIPQEASRARIGMGVGRSLNARSPLHVYDVLAGQLVACQDPVLKAEIAASGLFPDAMAEELVPAVAELKDAVHGGMQGEVTTATVAAAEQKALLQIEVTLSRAVVFLETWVSIEAGEALEKLVPFRRKGGGAAAEDEGEGEGDAEGDGEEGDGTEEPGTPGAGSAPGAAGGAPVSAGAAAGAPAAGSTPEGSGSSPVASDPPPSPDSK